MGESLRHQGRHMKYADSEFRNQRLNIDGEEFLRCKFIDCVLVYSGGDVPKLDGCHLESTGFTFEGAAVNSIMTMTFMYHGGFKEFIEELFKEVRNFTPPPRVGGKASH